MEPIVSPWIFYWMDALNALRIFSIILAAFSVVYVCGYLVGMGRLPKKGLLILSTLIWCVAIFTPNPQTIGRMVVASYITPDNINKAVKTADKIADNISSRIDRAADSLVDKIKEIKE